MRLSSITYRKEKIEQQMGVQVKRRARWEQKIQGQAPVMNMTTIRVVLSIVVVKDLHLVWYFIVCQSHVKTVHVINGLSVG